MSNDFLIGLCLMIIAFGFVLIGFWMAYTSLQIKRLEAHVYSFEEKLVYKPARIAKLSRELKSDGTN